MFIVAKLDKIQGGCRGSQDWCHFPGSIFEKVYFLAFLRKAIKKDLLLDFNEIKQKVHYAKQLKKVHLLAFLH